MAKPTKPPETATTDSQRSGRRKDESAERLRRKRDGGQETSGGEDMAGEGSPGLTITGGGGHA